MATIYWEGQATAVAQVASSSIDSVDATPANNTFTVTIGGVAISQAGTTNANTTAVALVALLNASTHPYFSAITWTAPGSGVIRGTADTAGVPFEAALTVTGGGSGTVTDFSDDTASSGPNDWSTADNWSGGAVPVNSDIVIIKDGAVNIFWGLDNNGVSLTRLEIHKTYTGRIGLNYSEFTTDGTGTTDSSAPEYRDVYLKIGTSTCYIGDQYGPGTPNGSQRICLDLHTVACQCTVYSTSTGSSETNRPCVRLKANSSSTDIFIRGGSGGVGIASEVPGETSTIGDISISGSSARVFVSSGVTLTNIYQVLGESFVLAAATITSINVEGGLITLEGDYTITTLNLNGGEVICNNIKTAGNAITTANLNGGLLDGSQSSESRTWATINLNKGGSFSKSSAITITTLNEDSDQITIQAS